MAIWLQNGIGNLAFTLLGIKPEYNQLATKSSAAQTHVSGFVSAEWLIVICWQSVCLEMKQQLFVNLPLSVCATAMQSNVVPQSLGDQLFTAATRN